MGWRSDPNKKYCPEFFFEDLQENAEIVVLVSSIKPKREEKDQRTPDEKRENKER